MKRFHVITNRLKDKNFEVTNFIKTFLVERGLQCTCAKEIPDDTECMIVLGGDGTLLQAARETISREIPLIGVNLGTLGYLAEVECSKLEDALMCLITDNFQIEERMMIVGKALREETVLEEMYALNDIVVTRAGITQMIYYHVYVNGQLLNSYNADGIILSTPTGSTGYNMSAGGPIVEPNANLIVMTPICPHTIYARSIVLAAEDHIRIEIGVGRKENMQHACVNFDGEYTTSLETGDIVAIEQFAQKAKIIKINQVSFLATLHDKMSDS